MAEVKESDFIFVPFDVATTAPGGLIEHFKDRWWCVCPNRGIMFYEPRRGQGQFPQCNVNKTVSEMMAKNYPWCEVRFIPSVYRRINPQDYA
jgi:hypothetical protein